MNERYITIKVRSEDHKKLKIKAAEKGVSMMELFSEAIDKVFSECDLKERAHKSTQGK